MHRTFSSRNANLADFIFNEIIISRLQILVNKKRLAAKPGFNTMPYRKPIFYQSHMHVTIMIMISTQSTMSRSKPHLLPHPLWHPHSLIL